MANIFEPRFLPASLYIEAILKRTTLAERGETLKLIKDGSEFGDAYGSTLVRIMAQDEEKATLAMAALTWIFHSERPLQVDELCHALAVEIGATDFDLENVPLIGTLLDCCQGLVIVDAEASTVRLIHYTAQEYLCNYPGLFSKPHSVLAEKCLTYLNLQPVKNHGSYSLRPLQSMPFLKYSARYWGTHMSKDISDRSKTLALRLLSRYKEHISAVSLLEQVLHPCFRRAINTAPRFSGLHCASFFGIVELVISLIEIEGCEVNQKDCAGRTPLAWAARNGHEGVVKALLEWKNVDPNRRDAYRRTSLANAALYGQEGVVKLLLEREDVDPNRGNRKGATPLRSAAGKGHEGVVRLLLERENVDPNLPDNAGDGPLGRAARKGHEGVVKLLLEWENVDPNHRNRKGATPLRSAAAKGHEGVVRLLLERENVDPNLPDKAGNGPLGCAARKGHEGMVKLLLERENVDTNRLNKNGLTPFHCAAIEGHEGVVKLLLQREDVDPNRTNKHRGTPLSYAATKRHGRIVQLLDAQKSVKTPVPCSQRSRAPVGPCGESKSHGRDRTAQASPSSSVSSQDGRHYEGQRAAQWETILGGERRGTAGDDRKQRKTAKKRAEDDRRRRGTADTGGKQRKTAEDDGRRRKTAGDDEGRRRTTKHRPSWSITLACGSNSKYYETD